MKRKLFALLLSGIISLNTVPVFAASYADINNVPFEGAKVYINQVTDIGIMGGDTNESGQKVFRANDRVNCCETMQIIYNVLKVSGKLNATGNMSAKYGNMLNKYNIPKWAHEAVGYGIENGIISETDVSLFMESPTKHRNASREEVGVLMGKALSSMYSINRSAVLNFKDTALFKRQSVPYIDLLGRLKIMQGDDKGYFNPLSYINRAETAVLASKTYSILADNAGGSETTDKTAPANGLLISLNRYNVQISANDGKIKTYTIANDTKYLLEGFKSNYSELSSEISRQKDKDVLADVIINKNGTVSELSVCIGNAITNSGTIAFMTDNFFKLELSGGKSLFLQLDVDSLLVTLDGEPTTYALLQGAFNSKDSSVSFKANIAVEEGVINKIVVKKQ